MTVPGRYRSRLVVAGIILAVLSGIPIIAPLAEKLLATYHLLPEPEPLTELYFEDHATLPAKAVAGIPIRFRFTLHNVEYADTAYPYRITVTTDRATETVEERTIVLPHDTFHTITREIVLTEATRSAVRVELDGRDQAIQFWLNP